MTTQTATRTAEPSIDEQAQQVLLPLAAGYVGHRTVALGLRRGLLAALADRPAGATADALADALGYDPFYVRVWSRAAVAAGVLDEDDGRLRLAPHMETLLLDRTSPAYTGALFRLLEHPEMFDGVEDDLDTGERSWWDEASPDFIDDVAASGRPFYVRLVPAGLERIPGLPQRLADGCRVLDTACGAGHGLVRLAETYPDATVVGADGDAHSLERARARCAEAGVDDRVSLVHTPLEQLDVDDEFDLVINNISMHECRDADRVTANVHDALAPGGWFVISDLPFPATDEGLRSLPGRVMTGIQYWEARIDDQLLPRHVYDELLSRHGFGDLGAFELTPFHAVTYGRA
jgi:SAM-dependent methyltransferase